MIRNSGWACDGRTIFPHKCLGGITDFHQTAETSEYHCENCNFDLCIQCAQYSYWADQMLASAKPSEKTWTGFYVHYNRPHEMKFTNLIIKNGVILGHGSDDAGEFYFNGFTKDKKVKFIKQYHRRHIVEYSGKMDSENKIRGSWKIDKMTDKFELKRMTN
jgi:hypothetical protein